MSGPVGVAAGLSRRQDRGTTRPLLARSRLSPTGSHPVVCINFGDAKAYVDWLSTKTGKSYRLLTEAEWEYAARAGTTTRFSFGDDEKDLCRYGNGADLGSQAQASPVSVNRRSCSDGYAYTAPVGSFLPNPFGLYDMHGNVRQWVRGLLSRAPTRALPLTVRLGRVPTVRHAYQRGGTWGYRPANLRSAYRDRIEPVGAQLHRLSCRQDAVRPSPNGGARVTKLAGSSRIDLRRVLRVKRGAGGNAVRGNNS